MTISRSAGQDQANVAGFRAARMRLMLSACILGFFSAANCMASGPAFDFFQSTHLLEISQESSLSNRAASLRGGSFEAADGTRVRFDKWYASKWADTRITFLTQLSPTFGVLWGGSTGERGEKYTIAPSFRYGFLYMHPVSKNAQLSFSATQIIGGRFKERSCTADYGAIGGVQEVNCRLAASELQPAQTLNYLIDEAPAYKRQLSLRYSLNF